MKVGVGYSNQADSHRAGQQAAREALKSSGRPVLTFLFTTDSYNQKKVWEAVKAVVGNSRLVGFCAGGIIVGDSVIEQGVAVLTLSGRRLRAATSLQRDLSKDPYAAGCAAGEELLKSGIRKGTVFVFPDGFGTDISEALWGLYNIMGSDFRYVGGAAGDNLRFFKTHQFTEVVLESDALAVALLDGVAIGTAIGHGWKPEGEPLVVTKASGKRVFEIDGTPAFEAYSARLGGVPEEQFEQYGMRHPLGFPDIWGNYLIRDPLTLKPDGSIEFVTEVPRDAVGYVMIGTKGDLIETAGTVAEEASRGVKPKFALIFDCISRYLLLGEAFEEELRAIRASIGPEVPIVGVLTFGEVGAQEEVPLFHNKTVAIAVGGDGRPEGKEVQRQGTDLRIAELSVLHEVSSMSFDGPRTALSDFLDESIKKAVRLFGVPRCSLLLGPENDRKIVTSWGFRDAGEIKERMRTAGPNQVCLFLGEEGELGELLMEKASPITGRERKFYSLFACQLKKALIKARELEERERLLEELREKEARFRALAEQSLVGIYIIAQDRFLYVNEAFANLFGYRPEEIIGRLGPLDLTHPEDRSRVARKIDERLTGKVEFASYTLRGLRRDGSVILCEVYGRSVKLGEQKVIIGTLVDLTDRTRLEEAILQAKQQWEATFDAIDDMIFLTDIKGVIKRVNKGMARKLEVEPAELVGRHCKDVLSCPHAGTERCGLWRVIHRVGDRSCYQLELPSLRIWVRSRAYGLYGPEGKLRFIVHVYSDVTEERRLQEVLKRTEEELRVILEGASDGFVFIDPQGIIRFSNRKMREILSDPHPEGKPLGEFFDERNRKLWERQIQKSRRGKGAIFEIVLRDVEGQKRYLQVSCTAYLEEGLYRGAFGIFHDVTKEKEAEAALEEYREALYQSFFGVAEALARAIEERDPYTSGHCLGVAKLAMTIGRKMGLPEKDVTGLYISGLLHDIGKVGVPVEILAKPGRLTDAEMALIRRHPQTSYEVLKVIDFPWPVAEAILQHHERLDGSGYPRGLKGKEIIREARILAVADVVDAMINHRPYRPARSIEEVKEELRKGRGKLYDPEVVDACLKVIEEDQTFVQSSFGSKIKDNVL